MSSLVKCTKCNIVINEVLSFVCNKIDVMDEDSICRICVSAFSPNEITTAKDLLFDSVVPKSKKKIRKKEGKTQREIEDIICLLKDTDPECIPIFVARDLQKLPPVSFDHVDVTSLLKDIVKIKSDITQVKESYVTSEEITLLKSQIDALKNAPIVNDHHKNVTMKRGACLMNSYVYDSGPMGLPPMPLNTLPQNVSTDFAQGESSSPRISSQPPINNIVEGMSGASKLKPTRTFEEAINGRLPEAVSHSPTEVLVSGHTALAAGRKSMADIVRSGEWKECSRSEEWKVVQKKKLRNRFIGKTGKAETEINEKFKAAEISVPIYIYNVSKEVAVCHIQEYIEKKSNVHVTIEKMNMKTRKEYDSYKIFVPKHKLDLFLSDEFWPIGVSYRQFINFGHIKRVLHKPNNDGKQPKDNA
ncbi:uncharacterized protein LOC123663686 [Melitaea cinxia]|uniref:uncharacterized protein LOC123663686 n=1 Tax=Melitaea cinxia TaxID=113334 RepID=UPI001E2740A0|nr:uncharacterized protein LOC123663686 [Melitaea cinxia]